MYGNSVSSAAIHIVWPEVQFRVLLTAAVALAIVRRYKMRSHGRKVEEFGLRCLVTNREEQFKSGR